MNEKIEAVADAIDAARYAHPGHPRNRPRPFAEADSGDREYATRLARAALAALPPLRAREEIARDDTADIRWAMNVLLEQVAAKFEANGTWDIWKSDAASLVRSFKHDLSRTAGQEWREPEGWQLVPKELTEDMAAEIECSNGTDEGWQRALAACPPLPAPPVAEPIVAESQEPQIKDVHLRLLRRGAYGGYIGLNDNMAIRTGEVAALGDLRRIGLVEYAKGPFPPGPPSMPPSVITEAGRAFLADQRPHGFTPQCTACDDNGCDLCCPTTPVTLEDLDDMPLPTDTRVTEKYEQISIQEAAAVIAETTGEDPAAIEKFIRNKQAKHPEVPAARSSDGQTKP